MACLARLSASFVTRRALFVTHRGISVIFSFITPWDKIARGIELETPLIARRSAHFVTRRLISLPTGTFRYPQGYFGLFSVHYPGLVFSLGIEAKVPGTSRLVIQGLAKAAGMAGLGLARRETTPPYICILGFSPCGRKKHLFVRGAY